MYFVRYLSERGRGRTDVGRARILGTTPTQPSRRARPSFPARSGMPPLPQPQPPRRSRPLRMPCPFLGQTLSLTLSLQHPCRCQPRRPAIPWRLLRALLWPLALQVPAATARQTPIAARLKSAASLARQRLPSAPLSRHLQDHHASELTPGEPSGRVAATSDHLLRICLECDNAHAGSLSY